MNSPLLPPDPHLDRLFARYWDDTLTDGEAAELNARLAADSGAREWFRTCCFQATLVSEWVARHPAPKALAEPARPTRPVAHSGFTRRRVLFGFGAGTLVGVAAGVLSTRVSAVPQTAGLRVLWTQGSVIVDSGTEQPAAAGTVVPSGVPITTIGPNAAAAVEIADGSVVSLAADTSVMLDAVSNRLVVHRGAVSADLCRLVSASPPVTLATAVAAVTSGGPSTVVLTCLAHATELQVHNGRALVADRTGAAIGDVRIGEMMTVRSDGGHTKQRVPLIPDEYTLDLSVPQPDGWHVGRLEQTAAGPVVKPEFWYDPYHSAVLSQIRSNNRWTRGMVRLFPDSEVQVKYRADREAHGEVVLVVRPLRTTRGSSGCLQWSGRFEACPPGEWRTLTVRADAMLDNKNTPEFGPPWVAFLLIFNTYDADIGLRVAGFRVSRPGGPVNG